MTNRWIPYPNDLDAPRYRWPVDAGDSYLVRTKDGRELWACYEETDGPVFYPCDDDGNAIDDCPLDVVAIARSERGVLGPLHRCPVVVPA